ACRLHVEGEDPDLEPIGDLVLALADAAEHDLLRIGPDLERAKDLAPRHGVDAGTHGDERAQHRQVRVRLHRVTDDVLVRAERAVEDLEVPLQRRVAVDVDRRAHLGRDLGQRHALAKQLVALVLEVMHRYSSSFSAASMAFNTCARAGPPMTSRRSTARAASSTANNDSSHVTSGTVARRSASDSSPSSTPRPLAM